MSSYRTLYSSSNSLFAQIAVIIAALLQILVPVLPSLGIGQVIGDQSDSVRTVITPAGWAFSIWGALYLGSLAFAGFQAMPKYAALPLLAQVRWPATGAFLGNALWAGYVQSYGLRWPSVVIIVFTLLCLLAIYRRLSKWTVLFSKVERWFIFLPLSALASWLTVATIVNIAAALKFHGIEAGESAPLIGAAVVLVGGLIAATALGRGRGNLPYTSVFLWALAAIYAAGGQISALIAGAVMLSALLVLAGTIFGRRRARKCDW